MLLARLAEGWEPDLHPRDHRGRFRRIGASDLIDGTVNAAKLPDRRLDALFDEFTATGAPDQVFYVLGGEMDRRDAAARYRAVVASVPDAAGLQRLSDDDVMDLYAQVTAVNRDPDPDTYARLGAELDRRTAAQAAELERPGREFLARPVAGMTEDDLDQASRYASALGDEDAMRRIFGEWERRERAEAARIEADRQATARAEAPKAAKVRPRPWHHRESTPEQTATIDRLVAAGWPYLDAYAEAHHLDAAQLRREEAGHAATGGTARNTTAALRKAYDEQVSLQYLDAEDQTRGHLLSAAGRAKNIDPRALFSGPLATARKYASEDLLRYWQTNPRVTFAEFTSALSGNAGQARRRRLAASAGKDFI